MYHIVDECFLDDFYTSDIHGLHIGIKIKKKTIKSNICLKKSVKGKRAFSLQHTHGIFHKRMRSC